MNKKRIDKLFYQFNHSKKPLNPKILKGPMVQKAMNKAKLDALKPL